MTISFFFTNIPANPLKNKKVVKKVLKQLFEKEGKRLTSLNCIFTSESYLLKLNKTYLNHNNHTDVITFDLSDEPDNIIGEIYISITRVKENAAILKLSFEEELRRVILHGALHLCAYKDKTKREITVIRELENEYLRFFES